MRERTSELKKGGRAYAGRAAYFDAAKEFTPYLGVVAQEAMFLVKTSDAGIGRSLFAARYRGEFSVLRRAVAVIEGLIGPDAVRGKVFVDVGANIGTATIAAVRCHRFGSAVAIEPEPENVRMLRANLLLNDLSERIEVWPVAASNEVGESFLVVEPERAGKHWIAPDPEAVTQKEGKPRRETITVETVTLDHLVRSGIVEPEQTGLLWMDAEGHEGFVLSGASALLEIGTPLILEWHHAYLEARGDAAKITEAVTRHYTHYVNMVWSDEPGRRPFALRPVEELVGLSGRRAGSSAPVLRRWTSSS